MLLRFVMACRSVGVAALALALSSCSDGGFATPSRQFSGVWLNEFEGSSFVEGATRTPAERPSYKDTDWFDWHDQPLLEAVMDDGRSDPNCHLVHPIRVTFVGHRTHYPFGGAGHMGLWPSKVTVHRTISAERLGPSFCYES